MFVHKASLPHVLPPKLYGCPQQHELEISKLFAPAWMMVGALAEAPNDGDFFTRELLGTPIIVRNFKGEIHTFLNVCPHRHCLLTHAESGHSEEFTCQYHGWEFMKTGKTGRIPDAQSFKPLTGGPECLRKFRTEVRGPLIFVSLNDEPPDLADQLHALTSVCDEFPASRWRQADRWSYEFNANWKVVVENTIESYHVATVHPKTLVQFGDEEHEIHENAGIMRSTIFAPPIYYRVANWLLPKLEPGCTHRYRLFHGFPNLFLIRIDAMLQVMTVEPLSATTCRLNVYVFTLRAQRETWLTRQLTTNWARLKCHVIRTVLAEDARLYPDMQRGMQHSPFHGTISIREELVYAFQDFVHRHCGLTAEDNVATHVSEQSDT